MNTLQAEPQTERRIFYSPSSHFIKQIRKPRKEIQPDGTAQFVDEKIAEFTPQGQDHFGILITSDPETIAALENDPRILSPEQYNDAITPENVKVQIERDENKRLVTQNNDLLAHIQVLEAQLVEKERKPSK